MKLFPDIVRIINKGYYWLTLELSDGTIGKIDFIKNPVCCGYQKDILKKENFDKVFVDKVSIVFPTIITSFNQPLTLSLYSTIDLLEPVNETALDRQLSGNKPRSATQ